MNHQSRALIEFRCGTFAAAALITAAILVACGKQHPSPNLPPEQDEFTRTPLVKSKLIHVNFYMDATMSLRGFLVPPGSGQSDYFTETLNKTREILTESWDETEISFWRFGAKDPSPVDGLLRFKNAAEFTDLKTYIEKPIRHQPSPASNRAQLKIILTDLFQDDNAVGTLAKELDDRYLKDESLAVGILGIRSAFSGAIDDLPGKMPAGAADSLPFYLLFAGRIADVRLGMKRMIDELPIPEKDCFQMVFASRMVDRLTRPLSIEPADKRVGYQLDTNLVAGARERNIPVLANVRREIRLKFKEIPYPEITALGSHISVAKPSESVKIQTIAFAPGKPAAADPRAASALTFDDGTGVATLDRSKLAADTIYLYQLDTFGIRGQIGRMDKWGLESSDRDRVLSRREFDKDESGHRPGKTPNLPHFLRVLSTKMFQSEIRLARYYFYVQAR